MTVTPLSRLLEVDSMHVVCFDRREDEILWPEFRARVAGLSAALAASDLRYWALDCSNAFDLACVLYGCWSAGKTPVLAPDYLLADESRGLRFDGVVRASGDGVSSRPVIALDQLQPGELVDPIIPATSDLVLFTSGSTGEPTQVCRTIRNFESELEVLESLFGASIGDARVYSTVSHQHVYGLLFRLLWPLVTKRAFATYNFEYPENLFGEASATGALVTSPALLKRIGHLQNPVESEWRIIFSSGGMLPDYAAADAMRLLGRWPVEVLGSTETSGVAWRCQEEHGAAEVWHTLPEVRVRQDDEGFLEVNSPFMGLSSWHRMGDKVRLRSTRSFELLGRGDHIVKIEEKRVSLAEIEQCAISLPSITDAAATALEDGTRQYVGLVVQLSESGVAELRELGRKDVGQKIRQSLGSRLDPVAVPKKIRYVDVIPVNSQGKRQPAAIRELFD
ncbi:MAG: AMP-binding protein [Gammaproteobacteria bacterium]|nr:AMP-binding protein [Gammaproteobacteria bacterium]MDH3433498.1 AMP-binding protein [Gammaproteobacteria bacterium]